MKAYLEKEHGIKVNIKRVKRLMKKMSIGVPDISYIRVKNGFGYRIALNSLDSSFCMEAAYEAIKKYSFPSIIHTDRGRQFIREEFVNLFE